VAIDPPLDSARTAVLSMDLQGAIVGLYTAGQEQALISRAADVLK